MRKGNNPQKEMVSELQNLSHRIIMPLYIPNLEGYYKHSFTVFKISLQSLLKTTNSQTAITIVNNGSCKEVVNYLNEVFNKNRIDEVIHTQKVGKLNSILKAIRASEEPYLTITDADVLFKENWLQETLKIFKTFKKVGTVGIVPQFKLYESLSHNVIFDNLFNKKMKFTAVKEPDALKKFYKSINWKDDYNKDYLKYNLTLEKQNVRTLVGCGHFVGTYKRVLFDNDLPFTNYLLGGTSETLYLDLPPSKKNMWKLTTEHNYAFHMGNTLEGWMKDYENEILNPLKTTFDFPKTSQNFKKDTKFSYLIKQRIFSRIFSKKWFKKVFYKAKGLPINVLKKY